MAPSPGRKILIAKMAEFNSPFWIAVIDFKKAFDTVEHNSLWQALAEAGVQTTYIKTSAALYFGQTGMVVDGGMSKHFETYRGTKQGYPYSPSIFKAFLQKALATITSQWNKRRYGIQLGPYATKHRSCNLRYADH